MQASGISKELWEINFPLRCRRKREGVRNIEETIREYERDGKSVMSR